MKNYPQQKKNIEKTIGGRNEIQWEEGVKMKRRRNEYACWGCPTHTALVLGPGEDQERGEGKH